MAEVGRCLWRSLGAIPYSGWTTSSQLPKTMSRCMHWSLKSNSVKNIALSEPVRKGVVITQGRDVEYMGYKKSTSVRHLKRTFTHLCLAVTTAGLLSSEVCTKPIQAFSGRQPGKVWEQSFSSIAAGIQGCRSKLCFPTTLDKVTAW